VKHPLDRLLRLRLLLEDVSRMELEVCLQELAQVETVVALRNEGRKTIRQQSFAGFAGADNAVWIEAEAMSEWTAWEQGILETARQKKAAEVSVAKASYLERRKEYRQVKSVIEARMAELAMEQTRREQRELDDWFGQRSRSGQ
jgi:hypothetical protein